MLLIKAIFFDIDGTLISFKTHKMTSAVRDALKKLRENGIKIFVATGRDKKGLGVVAGAKFDGYITLNGQYCYTGDQVIYENTICREDLIVLKNELEAHPFPCCFSTTEGIKFNYRDEHVEFINSITKNNGHPAGDCSNIENESVYQCMAFLNHDEEKALLSKLPHCTSARWHDLFCDISPIGGTKQNGIDRFLDHFGIDISETMAFGDGGNDTQMLEHVNIGVAMGNSFGELLEVADIVTDDVEHDGVVKVLRDMGLI